MACQHIDRRPTSEDIEQHTNPAAVVKLLDSGKLIGERAGNEPHVLTRLKRREKSGDDVALATPQQLLHDRFGHSLRTAGRRTDKSPNTSRSVYRRPVVTIDIESDKNIAGKYRRYNVIEPPRVATSLSESRAKADKMLPVQMALGYQFCTG